MRKVPCVIDLIADVPGENDIGDAVKTGTNREIFAEQMSIRQSEFYQAMTTGLKPEIMFEVASIEYRGELKLIFQGKRYSIIRTFSKNGEKTELVCAGLANGVS